MFSWHFQNKNLEGREFYFTAPPLSNHLSFIAKTGGGDAYSIISPQQLLHMLEFGDNPPPHSTT
jgi:hypothetical protein